MGQAYWLMARDYFELDRMTIAVHDRVVFFISQRFI